MKLQHEAFRAEVAECASTCAASSSRCAAAAGWALAKRWEQELARGGWVGIGWPAEHGGRALPLGQQVIFHEEYVRAGGPGRLGHIGETPL